MTQTTDPPSEHEPEGQGLAHLARLHKMSATAGVALGEYRAVNSLAVAALVLGLASWMSWLHPLLYLLPVAALALGLGALWQIRRSQGTQGGTALAGAGVLLAVALGGWALAAEVRQRQRLADYRQEIVQMLEEFGAALAASDYDAAYQCMSSNFRSEVNLARFRASMSSESDRLGGIRGASGNQLARVSEDASGLATADALMAVQINHPEPLRQVVKLVREPEGWRILEFERWFPRDPRGRR